MPCAFSKFRPASFNPIRLKARREEQLLESEFGATYSAYRAHTGGILPRIAHI